MATVTRTKGLAAIALLLCLQGCSGNDGGAATVGVDGGWVEGADGASITVPAEALDSDITLRIARDSVGAPQLPEDAVLASPVYAMTPHGIDFARPVRLRIPFEAAKAGDSPQRLLLLKAQPGGEWIAQAGAERDGDSFLVDATTFSYYVVRRCGGPIGCYDQQYTLRLQAITPEPTPPAGAQGVQPLAVSFRTINTPGHIVVELHYTTPPVDHGLSFKLRLEGGRQSREIAGGMLPPSPLRLQVPLTAADNGSRTLAVEIACVAGSTVGVYPAQQQVCSRGSSQFGEDATRPFVAVSNTLFFLASIPSSASTAHLVPGLSTQPQDLTVAGGDNSAVFSAATSDPGSHHHWQESRDGGATWTNLGSWPIKHQASPAGCNPIFPPGFPGGCAQVRVDADPALHSTMDAAGDFNRSVSTSMNGWQYRVRLVNAFGSVVSRAATLTVTPPVAPSFSQQPQGLQLREGQTASFTVVVTGTPPPTLVWQMRPNVEAAWTPIAGAAGATYTSGALPLSASGSQYRVVATNSGGSAESAVATVSVTREPVAPSISSQPQALTVQDGGTAVFAAAINGTAPLSYRWFVNDVALSGANAPVLRLDNVREADSGRRYELEISNVAGTVRSSVATLTVTPAGSAPTPVAPAIVTQPAAVTVNVGNTATFAVGVSGSGPFSFQWRKGSSPIAGATAAAYTVAGVETANAGSYSVVISSSAGTVTSGAAVLTVNAEPAPQLPAISTGPAAAVVLPGGSVTFAIAASGTAPLAYQWSHEGTAIAGATGPVLHLTGVTGQAAGSYSVSVGNAVGSVASGTAQLIVIGAPLIKTHPRAVSVSEGATASFSVDAGGDDLRYQWLRDDVVVADGTAASYTTPAVTAADNGTAYRVLVYNGAGAVLSSGAVLTVESAAVAPQISSNPKATHVASGGNARFEVLVTGSPAPALQWQSSTDRANWSDIPGAATAALTVPGVTPASDRLWYRVVASNSAGSVSSAGGRLFVCGSGPLTVGHDVSHWNYDQVRNGTGGVFCPQSGPLIRQAPHDANITEVYGWVEANISSTREDLGFTYNRANGQLISVFYSLKTPTVDLQWLCATGSPSYRSCSGVSVDPGAGHIAFTDAVIGAEQGNAAITLNGSLFFTPF